MAMEEILDAVRRVIHRWVNTTSRIQTDLNRGDTLIPVKNANRYSIGDQVMLSKNNSIYETGLVVEHVNYLTNCVTLSTGILKTHLVTAC